MAKDKSPEPDGWPANFFLHFFDLMGSDLVNLAETVNLSRHIPGFIKSTFLTLIPKIQKPFYFYDYRPISLCNVIYKMMSISSIIMSRVLFLLLYLWRNLVSCLPGEYRVWWLLHKSHTFDQYMKDKFMSHENWPFLGIWSCELGISLHDLIQNWC